MLERHRGRTAELRLAALPAPPRCHSTSGMSWRTCSPVPSSTAYGMTEASHQMTSNPCSARRAPASARSVLPAGADVAVLGRRIDRHGTPGVVGEVVIRGPGVMHEYLSPSSANDTAWQDGWFRTGDLGSLDALGYLTLHGRLKETHQRQRREGFAVRSRICRAVPSFGGSTRSRSPRLIRSEASRSAWPSSCAMASDSLDEHELRRFAADRLAPFKTPRRIVVLDEIPTGATGKVQRSRLSSLLGLVDISRASDKGH